MSISIPNFGQYLADIMEYGPYDNQSDAANAIGVSRATFSLILNGQRTKPTWDIGAKIIREHGKVMEKVNAQVHE